MARHAARRRPPVAAIVVALLVVAGVVLAITRFDGTAGSEATRTPTGSVAPGPSDLFVLSLTGADHAYVAVIGSGSGRDPAAIALEPGTTFEVPGLGETTLEGIAALEGDSMRIAVSNAIGAWIPDYAVTDLDRFATLVDRQGGLRVDLADVYTVSGTVLGPDRTTMTGAQVAAFLEGATDDGAVRWASVLDAILAAPPAIRSGDFLELDTPSGAAATLAAAKGAVTDVSPTRLVVEDVRTPLQPDFDQLVRADLGTTEPVRVLVRNGNGRPGVGEAVARLLLPEGFRIVLSEDAESFDHATTQILATGDAHVEDARKVRDALGVGIVKVSQVPSGLADVTIVVGKDFS